ncbi:hypothetical protein CWB96_00200 [Pseudoalteromonas citrea]|uniref:Uncharacterized protein n=1 Tax=Pseudoalteromonas citrea TaxID=43655 RepID=A0A5S3XVC4_9GAMM|nr:hypothetical protein [Pseudoalteromonas citrea]TMP46287.1 hypothetical protein CWB97_02195 [Pseudoalteromonas citrea]TMP63063.1 hypothetical protein CWB96_00200 [Pseudoalteromonas citrea]
MAFDISTIFTKDITYNQSRDKYGVSTLSISLKNQNTSGPFFLEQLREYVKAQGITLKTDTYNSYISFYLLPRLNTGVNGFDRSDLSAPNDAYLITHRVSVADLIQSQEGSDEYAAFNVSGLPSEGIYKCAFELVSDGVDTDTNWFAPDTDITLAGSNVPVPTGINLSVTEVGDSVQVNINTINTSNTNDFILELVDDTLLNMPEFNYEDYIVKTSEFTVSPDSPTVFTYNPHVEGLRKYVNYSVRIRARKIDPDNSSSVSVAAPGTVEPFVLPWLTDFVDQTVIKGKQIEDSLVAGVANELANTAQTRTELKDALNTGAYSLVAEKMYELTRDVAVTKFRNTANEFDNIREQLRTIALYSNIDPEYTVQIDLTNDDKFTAFNNITKQGFTGGVGTRYFTWLNKAFYLGPVAEGGVILERKFEISVRGDVYRDRAEMIFS